MSIEAMKQALEALETLTKEMLTLRDELAERGGRPKASVFHQRLWDSSHEAYVDTAIPAAESLRQAIEQAEQKPCLKGGQCKHGSWCSEVYCQEHCEFVEQAEQAQPVAVTAEMARAFHRAITDGPLSQADEFEIQTGLEAAFAHITAPPPSQPLTDEQISLMAHNDDPGDWNDLRYRDCWHKGYKAGARAAHGIKGEA